MDYSIQIVYIFRGPFTSEPEDCLFLANSVDPDVRLHSVVFHLGLHCSGKYLLNQWLPVMQNE